MTDLSSTIGRPGVATVAVWRGVAGLDAHRRATPDRSKPPVGDLKAGAPVEVIDWVTGEEPMTGAQRSYLKTLCEEARQPFDDSLTKAEASKRIDELQALTGRGTPVSKAARGSGKPSERG